MMLFSISMRKMELPLESIFFVTFGTCEKIEVKRGHLVKKWDLGQTKKKIIISIFKTRICALWPMIDFCIEVAQIWDLSSKIQGFEAFAGAKPRTSRVKHLLEILFQGKWGVKFQLILETRHIKISLFLVYSL